ncbi:TIGR03985 family CRISPR-associated protein [Scytonema hofmannii FACHB-248]|uniref:TIGR03985 family CRISPR-associated protein n=1 Tax=Scytonema hofmannii FACHB-248 TaxID=1842502 RepID=A0ABR8GRC3_9CYAN|nr:MULTISPECIES: TIGR03985 family CRISPR-associated protein [Nostocales]MBD2605913.1 TIGR03985 family CRISPR-associated protein [Scytonema hofmannii FACHB-248]
MKREAFNYPPTVEVLKLLTPGSLKQNLAKAVRLWVILRSIYGDDGDEVKLELTEEFTFMEWRYLFFLDAKKHHLRDKAPILHHEGCRCTTKLTDWLFLSNLSVEKSKWRWSFQQYYSIQDDELDNLLLTGMINTTKSSNQEHNSVDTNNQKKSYRFSKSLSDGRLFAVTSRNLKDHDFQSLVNLGWLKIKKLKEQDTYLKVDEFPEFFLTRLEDVETQSEQFTNEELSAFNNSLSQPINGIQRFFIHAEYIVHPQLYNRVELLKKKLKNIWKQDKVPLVKLTYQSAKLFQDTVDCIVYPVSIYYYQRAPYLFAYGQTPKQDENNPWSKIDWYDYRLDRILQLDEFQKDIDEVNIPKHFVDKCQGKYPPSPDDIKHKMSVAWGFDIYKPQELLVLRFEQYFYGNYILGTERDEMFTKISRQKVEALVKSYTPAASIEQKNLLSIVQSRSDSDIYCKVDYRKDDNNIIMRLRAWGQNVEVILPWDLRQRMKKDMEATYKLYR